MEYIGHSGIWNYAKNQARIFEMPTETMLMMFTARAVKNRDITTETLGLYSRIPVGRHGKARVATLSHAKHLFQSRKNCMTWTPKGQSHLRTDTIELEPIEAMMEQCPDTFMGDCLEYILGKGNDVRSLIATPEGRQLYAAMLDGIFLGLGNSLFAIVDSAGHPLITQANTNGWYDQNSTSSSEYDDWYDQQTGIAVKGHKTLIDEATEPHLNIAIHQDEVSDKKYQGNIPDLIARVDEGMTSQMRSMKRKRQGGILRVVTPGIFDAIEQYITGQYGAISENYRYHITGQDNMRRPLEGVIKFDGINYILDDEQEGFDEMTGTVTHRVLSTVPGNLGYAHDVDSLAQFSGMGLRIEQPLLLRDKGRITMNANLKVNTAILDKNLISNTSITLTP